MDEMFSLFAKTVAEQPVQFRQSRRRVLSFGAQAQARALSGTQHQEPGHAAGAGLVFSTEHCNRGFEPGGGLGQRGGGAQMKSEAILYFDGLFRNLGVRVLRHYDPGAARRFLLLPSPTRQT
jgi:hypothetical protein